jgi:hypothetical protein
LTNCIYWSSAPRVAKIGRSITVELLTWRGLVTYYVLFFIHLESRKVSIAGITDHPEACCMRQMACNATWEGMGDLNGGRYLLYDRDAKFCAEFRETLAAGGVTCLRLPPRSPDLNAFAERWVRSVKEECLSHLILFGERSLRKAPSSKNIITKNVTIKARTMFCSSPPLLGLSPVGDVASAVENASATYSGTARRMNILTKRGLTHHLVVE